MPSRSEDTVTQWQQQPASLEYHLGGISIADDVIEEAIGRLIETDNPHKLYLFGSYARGHPWEPPDLDFLVVEDKGEKTVDKRWFVCRIQSDLCVFQQTYWW